MKRTIIILIAFSLSVLLCSGELNAAVVTHNIGTGNLIIPGNSTNDYVITGSTTNHYVQVQLGYHGSITLRNCSFNFSGSGTNSPIRIVGKNDQSNEHPLTVVNLILEGNNTIQNDGGGRACIQVDQGAQINISAIDPCDNNSGTLVARQQNYSGGAAIGSLVNYMNPNETTATASLSNGRTGTTAGGNVVVSSGTITARGGHGAGIGGGYTTYYDGMIVIYGGVVNATADFDAAGIGSGCPEGTGVIQVFAPHSAVIALPPAVISAKGAGATSSGGVGHNLFSELGLAGTKVRVYIGDPGMTSCPIRVYTEDHTPDANIYVDLSQDPDIYRVVTATVDPALLDINQVLFGTTNASGVYSTTGKLNNNTTFFTDAISVSPSSYGHPYLPKVATLPSGGTVQLERLMADFSVKTYPSSMLVLGYTSAEARANAACVKLVYNDANPIENVQFDLANGAATDFDDIIFLAADSTTVIPAPTTLRRGDTYYIVIPVKTGKGAYLFSDVFRIIGVWQGTSTSYIRQIVSQIVGDVHTETICSGSSYVFHGEVLTEPGMYSNVTTTTSQCQAVSSVEILNLIVNPPVTHSFEEEACDRFVWNGVSYTASGRYEQQLQTQHGCDSVVTLDLTIHDSYSMVLDTLVCDLFEWDGSSYTTSGEYTKRYESVHGCDSVVKARLTVGRSYDISKDTLVCEVFDWDGSSYTETGEYTKEYASVYGCDSVVTVNLTVAREFTTAFDTLVCDVFRWNGENYTESGSYEHTYSTVLGCDSVVTANLTVDYRVEPEMEVLGCDQYQWNDSVYYYTGTYTQQFYNVNGCDSVVTKHLDMNYTPHFSIHGDHWPIGGTEWAYTKYTYKVALDQVLCQVDSVSWSVDHPNMSIRPKGDGLTGELRIFTFLDRNDSVPIHVVLYNRCGEIDNTIWIHTTYYDVDEHGGTNCELKVYPNPNPGQFNLETSGLTGRVSVTMHDTQGVVVKKWEEEHLSDGEVLSVDCTRLRDGVYTLRVQSDTATLTKRIVISK